MKKSDIIIDAIGELDENTLNTKKPKRNTNVLKLAAVAAACLLIVGAAIPVMRPLLTKAPEAPEVTEKVTKEEVTTINKQDDTSNYISTSSPEITDNSKPSVSAEAIITECDFYGEKINLPVEVYGNRSWLTDEIKKMYDLYDYNYRPLTNASVYFAKEEQTDIHELELRIFNNQKYANTDIMVYIEADGAEIISDNIVKTELVDHSAPNAEEFRSVQVQYKFSGEYKLADIKYVVFISDDSISYVENYLNEGNSVFTEKGVCSELKNKWVSYAALSVFKIKNTVFMCRSSYDLQYMYEIAAIYFNDVDENGVPMFLTNPYISDYYKSPWCVSKRGELKSSSLDAAYRKLNWLIRRAGGLLPPLKSARIS